MTHREMMDIMPGALLYNINTTTEAVIKEDCGVKVLEIRYPICVMYDDERDPINNPKNWVIMEE